MKIRIRSKALAILMSLAMVCTMIPMMGQTAYATDHPSIELITDGELSGIRGLYFGNYPQTSDGSDGFNNDPILWRVLEDKVDDGELFLLSEMNLDCRKYNEIWTGMTWEQSTIRAWLNGTLTKGGTPCTDNYGKDQAEQTFDYTNSSFIDTAFSSGEQAAIATTNVKNKKTDDYTPTPYYTNMDGGNDTDDKIFLLSINDAQNGNYGFTTDDNSTQTREAKNTDYAKAQGAYTNSAGNGYWWLRSPGIYDNGAAGVGPGGYLDYAGYDVDYDRPAVRPALNLNLESAIFTSAAEGGKSAAVGNNYLARPGYVNEDTDWKLTIKDEAHEKFKVDKVTTCDGKTLNIKYSGAAKNDNDNEYISAIIKDNNGTVKYYGKLAEVSDEAKAEVNIDGKMTDGDTLCIFNEQCNDDYETDFSSPLQEITIPTDLHDWSAGWSKNGEKHWHECTVCHEKKDELAHNWSAEWSKDGDKHWHECTTCNEKKGETDHEWETATCIDPKTCKECGATDGEPLGHKYGAWTKLDANQHQRVCEHDAAHVEKAIHTWDAGKVTTPATTTATGVKTFTCTVCKATKTETIPKLAKKANPLKIKAKTAKVKYSKLKKKNQTLKVSKVITFTKKGQGKMSYTKASGNKKITINKTTGKVTVKKGLKKGTYKVKVKVKAAGNANYKASAVKTVIFKIKVK